MDILSYSLIKDAAKFSARVIEGVRNDVTLYGLDRWQPIRRELLQKLTFADTYLSVAYVKAKNGKSRYWATPAGRASLEFDKRKCNCLRRRVVIFGPSVTPETLFVSIGTPAERMSDWLASQHNAGIDLHITKAAILRTEIGEQNLLACLGSKVLPKLIRKNPNEVPEAMVSQAMSSGDFHIMDIGIYGLEAVGCQITDDGGGSVAFVLSRRTRDIIKARDYFNLVCGSAERFCGGSPERQSHA